VFDKIQESFVKAREYLKQKGIEVHSVELIGGGSRIPEFIRVAKETLGHEPSRTLNSS
jgi:molecular chaperone DnaK (HSP70)